MLQLSKEQHKEIDESLDKKFSTKRSIVSGDYIRKVEERNNLSKVITRQGDKYVLHSKDGSKKLGEANTLEGIKREGIKRRERQVQHFKHKGKSIDTEDLGKLFPTRITGKIGSKILNEVMRRASKVEAKAGSRAARRYVERSPVGVKPRQTVYEFVGERKSSHTEDLRKQVRHIIEQRFGKRKGFPTLEEEKRIKRQMVRTSTKDAASSAVKPREAGKIRKEDAEQNITPQGNVRNQPVPSYAQPNTGLDQEKVKTMQDELSGICSMLEQLKQKAHKQGLLTEEEINQIIHPLREEANRLLTIVKPIGPKNQVGGIERELTNPTSTWVNFEEGNDLKKAVVGKILSTALKPKVQKAWTGDSEGHARAAAMRWAGTAGRTALGAGLKAGETGLRLARQYGPNVIRQLRRHGPKALLGALGSRAALGAAAGAGALGVLRQLRQKDVEEQRAERFKPKEKEAKPKTEQKKPKPKTKARRRKRSRKVKKFLSKKTFIEPAKPRVSSKEISTRLRGLISRGLKEGFKERVVESIAGTKKFTNINKQKGWHGDPEGHAEAARARWEGRGRVGPEPTVPKDTSAQRVENIKNVVSIIAGVGGGILGAYAGGALGGHRLVGLAVGATLGRRITSEIAERIGELGGDVAGDLIASGLTERAFEAVGEKEDKKFVKRDATGQGAVKYVGRLIALITDMTDKQREKFVSSLNPNQARLLNIVKKILQQVKKT